MAKVGVSYLHPISVDWIQFGNNRRQFWGGNIESYKTQIASDLQSLVWKGYDAVLLIAPSDYNLPETKANLQWAIETASNYGLLILGLVSHLTAVGDPMVPGNSEYPSYVDLMSFFASFGHVVSVSNFSYTLNTAKIMTFYDSLPAIVKNKFRLHADDPFLETYIPIALPHLFEAYAPERIALVQNKNEWVMTGVDLNWLWVNGDKNVQLNGIKDKLGAFGSQQMFMIWTFADDDPYGQRFGLVQQTYPDLTPRDYFGIRKEGTYFFKSWDDGDTSPQKTIIV